ncbi:FAD-dependent monooxygenase [Streptomyces sp. NPDC023327]|uniref:FAD-dependent monooxygenase n=1 Tax=Streptomyces sp. NPDC023327 TaxID=3157088 RepID=UPI0033D1B86E
MNRFSAADHRARDHYDVVVAGGGPAGCATALTLLKAGRSVLLADAGTGPPKAGEALVSASKLILDNLGVTDAVLTSGHLPWYGNLSAWGSPHLHAVDFINDPYGHGWHLDRPLFDRQLRAATRAAGAEVAEHSTARHPRRRPDGTWQVDLHDRQGTRRAVHCRWLVDATGRRAAIAVPAGAHRRTTDRLTAFHLTLPPAPTATDTRSLVESAPDGWWYTTLLPSRRRLVSYFTDPDLPTAPHRTMDFHHRLRVTRHVIHQTRPHALNPLQKPRRAPAHSTYLEQLHAPGWTATGDAAIAFDPLSSQGILTALYTGLSAGQAVDATLRGDHTALDTYTATITTARAAYQHNHHAVQNQETRWPHHPFWARRRANPSPSSAEGITTP